MIEIISQSDRGFPVVDFKFYNGGSAAALMWKFAIEVEAVEINRTPVISGAVQIKSRYYARQRREGLSFTGGKASRTTPELSDLTFSLRNNGWGDLRDARVVISEPTLNRLVPKAARSFMSELLSGEATFFAVGHRHVDREEYSKLLSAKIARDRQNLIKEKGKFIRELGTRDEYLVRHAAGIRAGFISDKWDPESAKSHYLKKWAVRDAAAARQAIIEFKQPVAFVEGTDETGSVQTYKIQVKIGEFGGVVQFGPEGFGTEEYQVAASAMGSDRTYCTVLNLEAQPETRREYTVSRKIPAGDAERFQIMVGADRSASVRARFLFYLGDGLPISSDIFELKIWNPRGSGLHYRYRDGREIFNKLQSGQLEEQEFARWARKNANFPFSSRGAERSGFSDAISHDDDDGDDLEIPSFLRRLTGDF
jgi:hypothetical protein